MCVALKYSPEGIIVTMEERICERDEFKVWSERSRDRYLKYAQDEVDQPRRRVNRMRSTA